ncbi:carbohydrate-binding family 9-like protein [uncultured Microbacterium sp.]|uniref:carbohydrate-binding family 9-like protein n=1 Tax=uncultured Microbacterium sp. TaxID=191216 RepID=UPI0035CC4BCB
MNDIGYGWRGAQYRAVRADAGRADGDAGTDPWAAGIRTPRFVDIASGAPAPFATSASVTWDDDALYVALDAEEPFVTATSRHDGDLLFFENDLELFIDGGDTYYELEVNAFGTRYEVFYIWRDAPQAQELLQDPRFDVHAPTAHTFGGDHERTASSFWTGNHPRGTRWAFLDYRLRDLHIDVAVDGEINDPAHVDRGWSVRLRIPWDSLSDLAGTRSLPPREGDTWRMFFGRFEQLATRAPGVNIGLGWAANPHGLNDTHIPEAWTNVTFVSGAA